MVILSRRVTALALTGGTIRIPVEVNEYTLALSMQCNNDSKSMGIQFTNKILISIHLYKSKIVSCQLEFLVSCGKLTEHTVLLVDEVHAHRVHILEGI